MSGNMNFEIPRHLQRKFTSTISELQETAGWEATIAFHISLLGQTRIYARAPKRGTVLLTNRAATGRPNLSP
jgi:hypothetical protein